MTQTEFHEAMLNLLRQEPFAPFDIELTDGRVVHVAIPEEIATNAGTAIWGAPDGNSELIFIDYRTTRRLGVKVTTPA